MVLISKLASALKSFRIKFPQALKQFRSPNPIFTRIWGLWAQSSKVFSTDIAQNRPQFRGMSINERFETTICNLYCWSFKKGSGWNALGIGGELGRLRLATLLIIIEIQSRSLNIFKYCRHFSLLNMLPSLYSPNLAHLTQKIWSIFI